MNRIYFAIMFICILSFVSFAQKSKEQSADKPNFTGTWEITNDKSYPFKNRTLIITQMGDELKIVDSLEFEGKLISNKIALYSDKRGERNLILVPGADSEIEVKSTTFWKKDKLIRKSIFNEQVMIRTKRYLVVHKATETYILSKDGSSLTLEATAIRENPLNSSLPVISSGKRVYSRKN